MPLPSRKEFSYVCLTCGLSLGVSSTHTRCQECLNRMRAKYENDPELIAEMESYKPKPKRSNREKIIQRAIARKSKAMR